jgi:hypothetical protein
VLALTSRDCNGPLRLFVRRRRPYGAVSEVDEFGIAPDDRNDLSMDLSLSLVPYTAHFHAQDDVFVTADEEGSPRLVYPGIPAIASS